MSALELKKSDLGYVENVLSQNKTGHGNLVKEIFGLSLTNW